LSRLDHSPDRQLALKPFQVRYLSQQRSLNAFRQIGRIAPKPAIDRYHSDDVAFLNRPCPFLMYVATIDPGPSGEEPHIGSGNLAMSDHRVSALRR
jgi:hypothetical protein